MAKKRIRLALIGCGDNMQSAHVPRIQADGAVDIVALADPNRAAAEQVMATIGAEPAYYADWRRMLAAHEVDAVVISTPHDLHYAQARAGLVAGVHVLVEKPLTISVNHAKRLLALAEGENRMLVVAYQRHFLAPYRYARELIRRGRLGNIEGVVGYVTQGTEARIDWRLVPEESGGGMFADTGSHLVASTLWLTGLAVRWVSAIIDRADEPSDVNMLVQVRFDNGALGQLSTFGAVGRHDERLSIFGTKGTLVMHMHQWRFRSMLLDDEPVAIPRRVVDATPLEAFLAQIRNGGRGYEPATAALAAVRLTAAAYRSAERGEPIRIGS